MKVIFIKKATLIFICGLIVFFSIFAVNNNIINVSSACASALKKLPIYSVDTNENKLSISFDAAWGADKTQQIMDVCDEFKIKATFFLVGFWVEKYPDMVKEIYNRGFEIGIHSNTHPDMTKLSKQEMRQELLTNIQLVENITGNKPSLFRPPYGYYSNALIDVCEELNLHCIQWSVDSLDWKGLSASEIAGRIINKAKNGSIILCHNNADNIVLALNLIFKYFKEKQMQVVPIGELIYKANYYINNQGVQIKK